MRTVLNSMIVLATMVIASVFGSGNAMAGELDEYLWQQRPLLVFAPSADDPRLVETRARIDSSRCEFTGRDMVLGQLVADGVSTLGGRVVDADRARRLADRYAVADGAFAVLLIGKDGGEKWRVDTVPDLQRIYRVIDGMPMRGREMGAAGGC